MHALESSHHPQYRCHSHLWIRNLELTVELTHSCSAKARKQENQIFLAHSPNPSVVPKLPCPFPSKFQPVWYTWYLAGQQEGRGGHRAGPVCVCGEDKAKGSMLWSPERAGIVLFSAF